jgi:hypothetical protein
VTRLTADLHALIHSGEQSIRAKEAAHCRRLRRWLRASIILNVFLAAAVAGMFAHISSSSQGAPQVDAPAFSWGTK